MRVVSFCSISKARRLADLLSAIQQARVEGKINRWMDPDAFEVSVPGI